MRLLALLLLALHSISAEAEVGLHIGGHFGYGKMGDEANDLNRSRNMGTFDLQGMPGYRLYGKLLLAGLLFDYRFIGQLTDKSATLSDLSGRSFLLGPAIVVDLPVGKLLFSYDIRARHYFSGPDTTYKGSGVHFLFGYKVAGNLCVDIEYVVTNYNTVTISDIETELTGDLPLNHKNLGFGLSWTY